jgi:hypothetical protein
MTKLRLAGAAVVMLCVLVVVVPAAAHEFVASKTGTLKGTKGKESFNFGSNKVICSELSLSGMVTTTKENAQDITVKSSGCEGFGTKVTATETEYEFEAEDSAAETGKEVVLTDAVGKCSIKVESSASGGSIKYIDTNKTVTTIATETGVEYLPSGGVCGGEEEVDGGASIEAEATAELEGGTIEWK